jgi:muramoyltetrapeptide carboxypeptidase
MPSAYLWCPAFPLGDEAHRQRTVHGAQQLCQRAGLDLESSPLLGRFAPSGTWLPAKERVQDLVRGLERDVLIAGRGGYGCLDLVEAALAWPHTRAPRLIGYSDLTVLHALWRRRGWGETLYGFMPGVGCGPRSLESTVALLAGRSLACDAASEPTATVLVQGVARGTLFAACLRVLAGLVGTPAMPDLAGCILAIEDIDERPYRIDRDLQQLARSGSLRGVVGLICGAFPGEVPAGYGGPSAADVCRGWAERLKVPALFGLPFGHHPDPMTLPCGRSTVLTCQEGGWSLRVKLAGADDGSGRF